MQKPENNHAKDSSQLLAIQAEPMQSGFIKDACFCLKPYFDISG